MIKLLEVQKEQRILLWNIFQKYLYEMTSYYDDEMDGEGNYRYEYFDAYFTEKERKVLFIYDGLSLSGFAMINNHSYIEEKSIDEKSCHVLAEYTVFPMYRRHHIATEAARQIFNLYSGKWEVKYNEKNTAAKNLWNKITKAYNPLVYHLHDSETVISLTSGQATPARET